MGARKCLFDSGSDQGDKAFAVRDTALEMVEAGLFRMPAPAVWIGDPFEPGSNAVCERNCDFCVERTGHVEVSLFGRGRSSPSPWNGCGTATSPGYRSPERAALSTRAVGRVRAPP